MILAILQSFQFLIGILLSCFEFSRKIYKIHIFITRLREVIISWTHGFTGHYQSVNIEKKSHHTPVIESEPIFINILHSWFYNSGRMAVVVDDCVNIK